MDEAALVPSEPVTVVLSERGDYALSARLHRPGFDPCEL